MSTRASSRRVEGGEETPAKRRRVTTTASAGPGPSTTRRRLNSEAISASSRSVRRSTRGQQLGVPIETPALGKYSTRKSRLPSTVKRPSHVVEEEDEGTPRAQFKGKARQSLSKSRYRPRASLMHPQATPLTIERRAGMLRDVAKAVLLEYVRFSDATDKHADIRRINWNKLQGAHMILSDEPTPTFLDLETVIGALPTTQKQYILEGRIPALQQGLDLSNVIGFLHIVIDPILASTTTGTLQGRTSAEAVTDTMLLAWKKFWTTVVGELTSETDAIEMWLDFSTQIYLQSIGFPDARMTSPTRQLPGLDQRAILNDMFSDTSYQKYAINDAKLESSGDVARKGLKHWSGISADRRRFLTERHGAECRQRFPYETFRNDMVAFVIAVLGTSRMLDMSAHRLAAAIDGEDPSAITSDELDSEAVASGLEPDTDDEDDLEDTRQPAHTPESTEEEQERQEEAASADDYVDVDLLREIAMNFDGGTRPEAPHEGSEEKDWPVHASTEQSALFRNAAVGPRRAGFNFAAAQTETDQVAFDSEEDDTPTGKAMRVSPVKSAVPARPATPKRTSSLFQRGRDVFDKALTPSRWKRSLLFQPPPTPSSSTAPQAARLPNSGSSAGGDNPPVGLEDDLLLPTSQALADDVSVQSSPERAGSSPLVESEEEQETEENHGDGYQSHMASPQSATNLSLLPDTQALEDDESLHSEGGDDGQEEVFYNDDNVYDDPILEHGTAPDEEQRDPSLTPLATRKSPTVKPRASQSAIKAKVPRPRDNDFVSDNDSVASVRRSPRQARPNAVRGPLLKEDAAVYPPSSPAKSPAIPRVVTQTLVHTSPAPAQGSSTASQSYQLPRNFRETSGRVTQLYASHLGDTDPFMVDEDGEDLNPRSDICMQRLQQPGKKVLSSWFGRLDGQKTIYSRLGGVPGRWTPAQTILLYRTLQMISEDEQYPLQVVELLHGENGKESSLLEMHSKQHMRDKLKEVTKSRIKNNLPVVGNARRFAPTASEAKTAWQQEASEREARLLARAREEREESKRRARRMVKRRQVADEDELDSDDGNDSFESTAEPAELESEDGDETVLDEIVAVTSDEVEEAPPAQALAKKHRKQQLFLPGPDDLKSARPSAHPSRRRGNSRAVSTQSIIEETDDVDSEAPSARRRLRSHTSKEPESEAEPIQKTIVRKKQTAKRSGGPLPPRGKAARKMTPVPESEDMSGHEQGSDDDMGQTQVNEIVRRAVAERKLIGSPDV